MSFHFPQQQKRVLPNSRKTTTGSGEFSRGLKTLSKMNGGKGRIKDDKKHHDISNSMGVSLFFCLDCSELPRLHFLHSERRIKPLLPRTDSYLVPIQLPVASSVYLSSSSAQFPPSSQQKQNIPRRAKRVRIAPKVKTLLSISEL